MPCDYKLYPKNWHSKIRPDILKRAGNRCERCNAANHKPNPVTGSKVVLTISHNNHDITNNKYSNLRALCQLCHNLHDFKFRLTNRINNKHKKLIASGQLEMF